MAPSQLTQEAARHLALVTSNNHTAGPTRTRLDEELRTAPLFTSLAARAIEAEAGQQTNETSEQNKPRFHQQHGLLGLRLLSTNAANNRADMADINQLVYANVSAPWSAFICGSQGSGKSHTLSCLLENALIAPSPAGSLSSPLAGLVLHYDKFTAFSSTQLCEAAYLCSSGIPVRVFVSPTNFYAMKEAYEKLPGLGGAARKFLRVVPMYLSQKDLNISMMKTLMGVGGESQPLYIEVVIKILREMATVSQGKSGFDYNAFKQRLENEKFLGGQSLPLNMRLEVLESFFEPGTVARKRPKGQPKPLSDMWTFPKGSLTIVDLSCPFVGPEDACVLFNICVSLFLRGRGDTGQIIALDEAHKFLTTTSAEAMEMTDTLLSVVRQQRHLSARVIISTQEPTASPELLDLCNVAIVHRFTSPAWYAAIERHIAGAAAARGRRSSESDLFRAIVRLATGEALVFCPTALIGHASGGGHSNDGEDDGSESVDSDAVDDSDTPESVTDSHTESEIVSELGSGHMWLRIRKRVTADGGRSQLQ